MMPYSLACSGDMKRSRFVSCSTFSIGWPVWRARISVLRLTRNSHSLHLDDRVRGVAAEPAGALVDHDPAVRQGVALARGAGRQQDGGHRGGHADADRADRRAQVLHRVVDGEPGVDDAAGRVDVQADVLLRVLGLEEQELGDDEVGDVVLDRVAEEDDPLAQQARVDVVGALAAAGGFDDHRHEHRVVSLGRRGSWVTAVDGGQPARAGSSSVTAAASSVSATGPSWAGMAPGSVAPMDALAWAWSLSMADGTSSRCGSAGCSGCAVSQPSMMCSTTRLRRSVLRMNVATALGVEVLGQPGVAGVALAAPGDLGVDGRVGDLDALRVGDLGQHEQGLDALLGIRPELGVELAPRSSRWP